MMKRIEAVFEDERCLVINKPAGLAVQGGKGVGVSLDALLARAYNPPPLLVHRLDKDTSGLILVAKDRSQAAFFGGLFAAAGKKIVKGYTAVCRGRPEGESGCIRLGLEKGGRLYRSETFYRLAGWDGEYSLLELELGTGRMHQIRRHLAMTGTPVLGDDKYGDFALNRALRKKTGLKNLLLHAARLAIPSLGIDLSAPPPDHWAASPFQVEQT